MEWIEMSAGFSEVVFSCGYSKKPVSEQKQLKRERKRERKEIPYLTSSLSYMSAFENQSKR
jgi:hypothetical protein